jgi:hypothetical protein
MRVRNEVWDGHGINRRRILNYMKGIRIRFLGCLTGRFGYVCLISVSICETKELLAAVESRSSPPAARTSKFHSHCECQTAVWSEDRKRCFHFHLSLYSPGSPVPPAKYSLDSRQRPPGHRMGPLYPDRANRSRATRPFPRRHHPEPPHPRNHAPRFQ